MDVFLETNKISNRIEVRQSINALTQRRNSSDDLQEFWIEVQCKIVMEYTYGYENYQELYPNLDKNKCFPRL